MHVSNIKKSLSIVSILLILFSYILTSGVLLLRPQVARAATITVTNTNDSGAGSLRQAILDANTSVGVADTIAFNIAGPGPHTIQPTSALPTISDQVTIDGTTQSGWVANTAVSPNPFNGTMMIEIDGQNSGGANDNGLSFNTGSDGSIVRGLVINRFPQDGISLIDANNITIQGNYLGTSIDGLTDLGNEARGLGSSSGTSSDNNLVGGLNPEDRNIMSGNSDAGGPKGNEGIAICDVCDNWTIQGNYVGVDATGLTAMSNESNGIGVNAGGTGNIIGGITTGAANVASGNGSSGIDTGDDAIVQGNLVGTGYNGMTDIGNATSGISTRSGNIIGGATEAARNIVSGNNTLGILVGGSNNMIQGNYIGTNINGDVAGVGNTNAALLVIASDNNLVGGANSNEANLIAGNGVGILASSFGGFGGLNNSFLGNSVYSNTGSPISNLGIDLLGDTNDFVTFTTPGVTLNDADDSDVTSNHLMNFPVINSITSSNGQVTINYDLDINDAEAGATGYRVEFFANDAADPSGYGEGQTYLGYENVAGDVTGQSVTLTLSAGVEGNKFISATTTMIDNSTDGFGHTSEFGALVEGNLVPTGSVTPAPAATLASTGRNSSLLLLISFMVVATGGVGLWFTRRENFLQK